MTKEELSRCTLGIYGNAFVYLKEDALGFKSGTIFKVISYDTTDNMISLQRKNKSNQSFRIDIKKVGLVKPANGYLEIIDMGASNDTSSITNFNNVYDNKLKIGDTTKNFMCSSSVDLECYWTPNEKHWWTTIDLLKFIPNDEKKEEPKAKVDTEEQIPTPLKAVKQATGLSIDMNYTYTPTDAQSEFLGIIEGFMITKKGIFVVDCTGDIIPADKCKKTK